MANEAIKTERKLVTAAELEKAVAEHEEAVSVIFQELVEDLHRGLPPATSIEVLNSRMKW